jgi:hypothetical protein
MSWVIATALLKILSNVKQGIPSLEPLLQATVDAGRVHLVSDADVRSKNVTMATAKFASAPKLQKPTHVLSFSQPAGGLESIETALQAAWHHNPCKDTSGLLARLKKR